MMFIHTPAKDFFVRAVVHAKELRLSELNQIEAALMIAEEEFLTLKSKGIELTSELFLKFENRIDDMKKLIRNKKNELKI